MEDNIINKEIVGSEINCQDLQAKLNLNSREAKGKLSPLSESLRMSCLGKAYLSVEIFAIYNNFSFCHKEKQHLLFKFTIHNHF